MTSMFASNNLTESQENGENEQTPGLPLISPLHAISGFDRVCRRKTYPKGSVLFAEGQAARGVYVLCSGRAKLSLLSVEGKALIVRIARPGDLLGIHATLAEIFLRSDGRDSESCRVDFISRKDLPGPTDRQRLSGLTLAIAISKEFTEFVEHARVLLQSVSANEKLARCYSGWGTNSENEQPPVSVCKRCSRTRRLRN